MARMRVRKQDDDVERKELGTFKTLLHLFRTSGSMQLRKLLCFLLVILMSAADVCC